MKKIACIFLSVLLLFSSVSVAAFAEEPQDAETLITTGESAPFIFVHGMGAWGSYEDFYDIMPYWGGWGFNKEADIIRIFNENGIEAYAASVGPFNSAWDRACELYAQLTGTVVDYGAAHSAAHNHDRYGFSYEDNQLMDECWDGEEKLNLVGHSFGVPAVRLFASLMAYGDEAEMAATGEDTSPLFTGGHDCVHAVVSLAGPHNGSPIANLVYDAKVPMMLISAGLNLIGATFGNTLAMWSLQTSHFGLTPKQGQSTVPFSLTNIKNFYEAEDNCGYDLTLRGAAELNEKIKTVPGVYYYSYTSRATTTDENDNEVPIDTMFTMFKPSSRILGKMESKTVDGFTLDKNWEINDGIVPLASALYPSTDAATARSYEEAVGNGETIEPGRWYYMPTMEGFDHFDFAGTRDYPTSFEDFYFTLAGVVNAY